MDDRREFSATQAGDVGGTCKSCGSCSVGTRYCMICGADRTRALTVIEVSHMVGPMWSINGVAVSASATDIRSSLLQRAIQASNAEAPCRIALRQGGTVGRVVVTSTGTVIDVLDTAAPWGLPKAKVPEAVEGSTLEPDPLVLVGAHTGAGTSTWARLLKADDAETIAPADGQIVVVCRSVPAGITAAKRLIRDVGLERVRAVLVVADAPGKPVPAAAREQRVLAGATVVVFVPWMPRLRGVTEISEALDGQLARSAQRISKALLGASTNKRGN